MSEILWTDQQLKQAGINKARLTKLVKTFLKCSEEMSAMGLVVYGESGVGNLIHESRPDHDEQWNADLGSVVAKIGPGFDGGGW